ncbi:MAG: dTMP kinase [bacterium]
MSAKFISVEGGEGSGKSTLLSRLKKLLEDKKLPVVFSFEPGGTELGKEIRESLIKNRNFFSARAEALLYAAARAQHMDELIIPSLQSGKHVIVDRFVDASLAYQGVARKLGLKRVRDLNEWATNGLYPDRTYLLDLDPQIGLSRAQSRQALDRIEREALSFHQQIRNAYLSLSKMHPERYVLIDASQKPDEVFGLVQKDLLGYLSADG